MGLSKPGRRGLFITLKSSKAPGEKKLVIWLEYVAKKRREEEFGGSSRLGRSRSGVFKFCLEVIGAPQLQDF